MSKKNTEYTPAQIRAKMGLTEYKYPEENDKITKVGRVEAEKHGLNLHRAKCLDGSRVTVATYDKKFIPGKLYCCSSSYGTLFLALAEDRIYLCGKECKVAPDAMWYNALTVDTVEEDGVTFDIADIWEIQ
jgi:hypothetical protein